MKKVDLVELSKNAVAQTMGAEYMTKLGTFGELDSYKLSDVGQAVTADNVISSFVNNLTSLLGKHVIDNRLYTTSLPSLYVDSFDWGGYLQRTRYGLADILDDPMYNLVSGRDYSDIEHTYYAPDVHSKIYQEAKPIMTPISINKEILREAFNGWDKLNEYVSGILTSVKNTINIALMVYEKMLVSTAIAISDKKNKTARHLITEAVELGILQKKGEVKPTYKEAIKNEGFLLYVGKVISDVRQYMKEPSQVYNDKSVTTWCDKEPNLILLNDYVSNFKFNLKSKTFNPTEISFGDYDSINSWQGIKDDTNSFDSDTISSISISADPTNKLGIGTTAYTATGVIGLLFDYMAIGISLMRSKVTSSYTACADFWNEFHHQLVNYLIDDSYGIVALICD